METIRLLEKFAFACAPSGYEKEMAELLTAELKPCCDSVRVDRLGNVIGHIAGTEAGAPRVMVFAHMDSVGFVVRRILPDGFLLMERLGGIPEKILPATELCILNDAGEHIYGVIGSKSHHTMSPEDKNKVDPLSSLFVDIGASSKQEVRDMGVNEGCFACYSPRFRVLNSHTVSATAMDNRGGCAALVHLAQFCKEQRPKGDVYIVGTVWEEFNLRGAMMASRTVHPDAAIALDVCLTGDTPDLKERYDTALGQGPSLTYYTFHSRGTLNGTIGHKGLLDLAVATAREKGLPLQRFASTGMLTDASYLQLEEEGVALIDMGFPTRYTHTPVETCNADDIVQLSTLVHEMLLKIDIHFDLNRYSLKDCD